MPQTPEVDGPWDAVVVGGGPAGLSAATWLARYRRRTLLLDAGEHRNRYVERAHGYLTRDNVDPREILETACGDLDAYGHVTRQDAEVAAVRGEEGAFRIDTTGGECFEAKRIVLATGVHDAFPDVDGFFDHYGASVFHCPSCDGYEARDCHVVVLGWDEAVTGFALELLDWAASVTVVTDGRRFEGDRERREALERHGVALVEQTARTFVGARGDLRSLRLVDGAELPCQMAFFSIGHHPNTDLAETLGCERDDLGYLVVDEQGQTTVPGVFAAGDVTPGYQLLQVATAKGTTAGVGCALSLRREPPLPDGPERAPDVPAELEDAAADDRGRRR